MTTHDAISDPERLAALQRLFILDTAPEDGFDQLAELARKLLRTPVALVSLVDKDRQFLKSSPGLSEPWASRRETPLSHSYCRHAVTLGEPLLIGDAREHPLTRGNPAITEMGAVAYAGIPLTTHDGYTIGTLCVIDNKPRGWTPDEAALLERLADAVLARIELRERFERERRHVAELEEARESLAASENHYRALIDSAADIITVLDAAGTIRYESPSVERILGYQPDELVGKKAFDFVHPDEVAGVIEAFERLARIPEGKAVSEFRFRHKDGTWRTLDGVGTNLLEHPHVAGIVFNSRDVTDSRLLEAQLRQAQKLQAVGQLTAGIAHDFKNTLAVILGNAELLAASCPPGLEEQRKDLGYILDAAQSGAAMLKQLLAFGRQSDLMLTPVDLQTVVGGTRSMLGRLLPAAIDLRLETEEGPLVVRADAGALQQILLNLGNNARDAMPEGGTLCVRLRRARLDAAYRASHPWVSPGEYIQLQVADTGTGMDKATLARVREPFFTTKPPGKGTGLGMSMVFGLVKQHGGYLDIESQVGVGTTVSILLPATDEPVPTVVSSQPPPITSDGETILLIDDQEALRHTGRRILERFGYKVVLAEDGRSGLSRVDELAREIDLVICDVEMPGLSGLDVYRRMRERHPGIKFAFSTGRGAHELQGDHGVGSDAFFLAKPWTVEEFLRTVRTALASSE